MKLKFLTYFDYLLIFFVMVLSALGLAFIYSSGFNSDGLLVSNEYKKQIVWISVGFVIMIATTLIDYRKIKRFTPYAYIGIIIILILTFFFGRKVKGARSWIGIGELGIQPSELGKIIFVLFLAWYLDRSQHQDERKRFIISLGIMLIPMGLILMQPDLGTATVYLPIFLFICYVANLPLRYIMLVIGTAAATIIFTVLPIWQSEIAHINIPAISVLTNTRLHLLLIFAGFATFIIGLLGEISLKRKYYYWIAFVSGIITLSLALSLVAGKVLKTYQVQRLIVFLDPYSDAQGAGWNIIQSKIAIGSGNLRGRGFKMGIQSHYRFLPEQSTDFIFSILAEEMGFIGGIILFLAFLGIFVRIIRIIRDSTDLYGTLICSGILGMFFYHFIINVGMVMGIMPITGIPLPFLSYGGSAYLTNMLAIGFVMSINARRMDFSVII